MKRYVALLAMSCLALTLQAQTSPKETVTKKYPIGGSYPSGAKLKAVPDLSLRLAKFKAVRMPFDRAGLTAKQVAMVEKLVDASQYLESIFWRQSDPQGMKFYQQLEGSRNPRDQQILRYLFINGGRFDLVDNNTAFVGNEKYSPDRGLYPRGVTREQIEAYVKAHPEAKAELYSPYTIVRWKGSELVGLPYHEVFRAFLGPAAADLRAAAKLSDDPEFAAFLRARADALLSDHYYASDLQWLDLKNPKIDIIFAPYEVYLDDVLGVKTSYGAAVMIRNDAESKKLEEFQQYIPEIQEALPLDAADKPDKHGQPTPMEVVDAPYRAGDLLHGYQAVADNLPNDPRIHQAKGTKKMFFKNFMDARVNYVILPLAKQLMAPEQARLVSGEGYMLGTIAHEISHGLGPAFARTATGKMDINEAIGPLYSPLEEAKADVTGMFALKWLVDKGVLPEKDLDGYYASYVADLFRSARFGVAEAHGQAEMMEFNFLLEQGAIQLVSEEKIRDRKTGRVTLRTVPLRYEMNYEKMPGAIASLTKELLGIEATGNRTEAEQWFAKYGKMPGELSVALESVHNVPVDIYPIFSFPEKVQ